MLDRVLLGDNPFIGVDHASQEKARDTQSRLNYEKMLEVMETAFSQGADGFVFSTHPTNLAVLELLKEKSPGLKIEMYPLLPYAQGYVRIMNEKGTMALFTELMQKLSLAGKVKTLFGGTLSALTMNPNKMLTTFIDAEIDSFLKSADKSWSLDSIFLHEIIVDVAIGLQLSDLFRTYIDHINDSYHTKAGIVTRNFPKLLSYLESIDQNLDDVIIMTPFNKIGFQMNPSREECEKSFANHAHANIIAMSLFAAGLISLEDSVEYVKRLGLRAVVIGTSRQEHARATFSQFSEMKQR